MPNFDAEFFGRRPDASDVAWARDEYEQVERQIAELAEGLRAARAWRRRLRRRLTTLGVL